jgi:hypothetical protein
MTEALEAIELARGMIDGWNKLVVRAESAEARVKELGSQYLRLYRQARDVTASTVDGKADFGSLQDLAGVLIEQSITYDDLRALLDAKGGE